MAKSCANVYHGWTVHYLKHKIVKYIYEIYIMKYNVYFIFSLDLFGFIISKFFIDLLQCNLESTTPITFLYVNKNIIYEYTFS